MRATLSKPGMRSVKSPDAAVLAVASPDASHLASLQNNTWTVFASDFERDPVQFGTFCPGAKVAAFSADNKRVAIELSASTVAVWEIEPAKIFSVMRSPDVAITSLAFSPAGEYLIAGCADSRLRLYSVTSGELEKTLEGHTGTVVAVAARPNTNDFASASLDGTTRLWNIDSDMPLAVLDGHQGAVSCLAYSKDGNLLASGGVDADIRLWDATSHNLLRVLEGHSEKVLTISFDGNAERLATASEKEQALIWDVRSGNELAKIPGSSFAMFSPNTNVITRAHSTEFLILNAVPWGKDALPGNPSLSVENRYSIYRQQALASLRPSSAPVSKTYTVAVTRAALAHRLTNAAGLLKNLTPEDAKQPALLSGPLYESLAALGVREGTRLASVNGTDPSTSKLSDTLSQAAAAVEAGEELPELSVLEGENTKTIRFALVEPATSTITRVAKRAQIEQYLVKHIEQLKYLSGNTLEQQLAFERVYEEKSGPTESISSITVVESKGDQALNAMNLGLGLQSGDRIRSLNGEPVTSVAQVQEKLDQLVAGVRSGEVEAIELAISRSIFETGTINITIE